MSRLRGVELNREAAMQMLAHLLSDIGEPASVDASAGLERRLLVGLGANDADGNELGGWRNGPPNVKTVGFRSRNLFPNLAVLDLSVQRQVRTKKRKRRQTGCGIRKLTCCSSSTLDLDRVFVCLSVSSISIAPFRVLGGLELPLLRPATA